MVNYVSDGDSAWEEQTVSQGYLSPDTERSLVQYRIFNDTRAVKSVVSKEQTKLYKRYTARAVFARILYWIIKFDTTFNVFRLLSDQSVHFVNVLKGVNIVECRSLDI